LQAYVMEGKGKERARSSGLNRTFCINLKQLIVLLLLVMVVVATVFWVVLRIDMHKRWASMLRESQRLRDHLDEVAYLLPAKFQMNPDGINQNWLLAELHYADNSLLELIELDKEHQVPLLKIDDMIITLRDPETNLSRLNNIEQRDLIEAIRNIGWKVANAYWNLINYTSVDSVNGPPFWYFGPSPPDEALLQEAVELAAEVKTKISSQ